MSTMEKKRRAGVSRRGFLTGSAGLTFAFAAGSLLSARSADVLAAAGGEPREIGGWVTIAPGGAITIMAPAAEMGQGVMTALPMILAEEMDADWSQVKAEFAPANAAVFGNPGFGGGMVTVASRSVSGYWTKIRLQGASVRRFLMEAAAKEWGVPVGELTTEPSVVVHAASGRRLSYGEIASLATSPESLPEVTEAELKDPADFRIIGQSAPRLDIPSKVDGSAKFGLDAQVPNMAYATVLRAPIAGAAPDTVDSAAVESKGLKVVRMPNAVAIVGDDIHSVLSARDEVKATWKGGTIAGYDSEPALDQFLVRAAALDEAGLSYVGKGDLKSAVSGAAKVVKGDYTSDYAYHAQMEPMNVTVSVDEDGLGADIWVGTQSPSGVAGIAAATLKTEPAKIRLHQHYLGGGFGRRAATETIPEALFLARELKRPVKLVWTREQDVKSAVMRPQTAHHLEAALDSDGNLVGWHHRIVGEAVTGYSQPARLEKAGGLDPLTLEGAEHEYGIANQSVEYLRHVSGTPLQAWRSIGAGYNKFAIEAFIDEIAHEAGADPVGFRLKLLEHDPRARAVVEATAEMADWGKERPEGHALGFAYAKVVGTYTAGVIEISLDKESGVIRAHDFWTAVDPGIVINPDTIVAQVESNVIFGLSQTLKERVVLVGGEVQQSNFHDYEVLRMSEMPEIHCKVMATPNAPSGMGEVSLPLIGGAVSNAVFTLTGKRLRNMPFTPDRVKATLV